MVEGDSEWFGQKRQQALSELREANPDALQRYGLLLRDNARRAGASPEEIWRRPRDRRAMSANRRVATMPRMPSGGRADPQCCGSPGTAPAGRGGSGSGSSRRASAIQSRTTVRWPASNVSG
jgi:hypothetical protein